MKLEWDAFHCAEQVVGMRFSIRSSTGEQDFFKQKKLIKLI